MKKKMISSLAISLAVMLFSTGCSLKGGISPSSSQTGVVTSSAQAQQPEPSQKSDPEPAWVDWPLPETPAGTVGEALLKLGISHSNGLTYWSDDQKQTDWNRHVGLQKPELQNALKDLLQLPLETDSTVFERAMRPQLCLYAGMLQIGDHQDFYEVSLSFPKTETEETGFQILLRKRFFGNFGFIPAIRKPGGSWSWDEKLEYSKVGETVFRVPGFANWYQRHERVLLEAMSTGAEGDLYSVHQAQILREVMEGKPATDGFTLGTLLEKTGYDWKTNKNIFAWWCRDSQEESLRSVSWTPLIAKYYQKLLQLPAKPGEEAWKTLQKKDPYFHMLLGTKEDEKTGMVDDFYLVASIDEASDSILLYEQTPREDMPLNFNYYKFSLDAKNEIQRDLQEVKDEIDVRLTPGWNQWQIEGFHSWLQEFEKELKDAGALECHPAYPG